MNELTLKIFASENYDNPVIEYNFPCPRDIDEYDEMFNDVASFIGFRYQLHLGDKFHMTDKLHYGNLFVDCMMCSQYLNK